MSIVKITTRHIKITDDIKKRILNKFDSLGQYFDQIKHIEIILDKDKDEFSIEAIVSILHGKKMVSKVSDYNYISAINSIADKIEKQLIKFKEKIKHSHPSPRKNNSELEQEDWL